MLADRVLLGTQLRKMRKEQKKRQEDFADEMISIATISLIERGLPNVKEEKVEYYADKLGFRLEEAPNLAEEERKKERLFLFHLYAMYDQVDLGEAAEGFTKLKKMDIHDTNPYYPVYLYLMARCKIMQREFSPAQRILSEAILCIDKYPLVVKMNTKSLCYYDLSKTFFYNNDFRNALSYAEEGIKAFQTNGEKKYLLYSLLISKSLYLNRLHRSEEALNIIDDLWENIDSIKNIFVLLNMYESKSSILKTQQRYEEAIIITKEGLELARYNLFNDRSFDLWVLLGRIYLCKKSLEEAEICFLTAISLKKRVDKDYLFMNLHTQLGRLYIMSKRWNEAKKALTEAISYKEKTYDNEHIISSFYYMGYLFREIGEMSMAMKYFQQAQQLAKEHDYQEYQHKIHLEMAKCLKSLDQKQFINCLVDLFEIELELVSKL
jgi:tetratricopeptide (TPR) repeat protein